MSDLRDQDSLHAENLSKAKETVHWYEVVARLLYKLSHSAFHILHTYARWVPPIWMVLFTLSNFTETLISFTRQEATSTKALKVFSTVVAAGLLIASFVFPPLAGVLFVAAMGFALIKSLVTTWQQHRQSRKVHAQSEQAADDSGSTHGLGEQYVHSLSCTLSFTGTVLLFTPLAPVGLALLAASLLMSVGYYVARWISKKLTAKNDVDVETAESLDEVLESLEETPDLQSTHHLSTTTQLAKGMVNKITQSDREETHEALLSVQSALDDTVKSQDIVESNTLPAQPKPEVVASQQAIPQEEDMEDGDGDSEQEYQDEEDSGTCHM